ncbi:MAG: hypothetical protein PVJ43_11325 [Gemmatimonadales bacterium]
MRARSSRPWSPGATAGVCSLFVLAFFFGGLRVGVTRLEYHFFGLVDGLAAVLVLYVLLNTAALSWPRDRWGGIVLIYAAAATAQLVSLLLPPPGLVEWLVLAVLLIFAWNAGYSAHRSRVMLALGTVALALAALKYSVLPFIWARTNLPRTPILDLQALAEGVKGLFAAHVPTRPITQVFAFAALIAWILAVWLQWPPDAEDDWLRRLPRGDRDRLLMWLLTELEGSGREIGEREARRRLESPREKD